MLCFRSYLPRADLTNTSLDDVKAYRVIMMLANQDLVQALRDVEHTAIRQMPELQRIGVHMEEDAVDTLEGVWVQRRGQQGVVAVIVHPVFGDYFH